MGYNKDKFKNAVLFFATYAGSDVGKKKLAKLLYFLDFTLYELKKESLTELPYTKKNYGPMPEPHLFYKALDDLVKDKVISIKKPNHFGLEKIIPKIGKINLDLFNEEEKEILMQVAEKYKLENAGELEKIAQSEPPYKMVNHGEEIPYHLAFYRNSFGEMDLDNANN